MDWGTFLASATVSVIGVTGAWASQRAAAKAATRKAEAEAAASVRNTDTTSRTDIEKEAFDRAKAYYSGALERQDVEIARQDAEITSLHAEASAMRDELREVRAELRSVVHELALREDDVRRLSAIVAAHGES